MPVAPVQADVFVYTLYDADGAEVFDEYRGPCSNPQPHEGKHAQSCIASLDAVRKCRLHSVALGVRSFELDIPEDQELILRRRRSFVYSLETNTSHDPSNVTLVGYRPRSSASGDPGVVHFVGNDGVIQRSVQPEEAQL